jgi:hypothetical protein
MEKGDNFMDKKQVLSMMNCSLDGNSLLIDNSMEKTEADMFLKAGIDNQTTTYTKNLSCWGYWQDYYYPNVIRESYPIYIQERAQDKGKKAFELIKILSDKKIIKLDKVKDFIDAMDAIMAIL